MDASGAAVKAEDSVTGLAFVNVEHSGLEFRERRLAPVDLQALFEFFRVTNGETTRGFRFRMPTPDEAIVFHRGAVGRAR